MQARTLAFSTTQAEPTLSGGSDGSLVYPAINKYAKALNK